MIYWCQIKSTVATNLFGAYLIVCTFFATLFGISATQLVSDTIDASAAHALAEVADKVVFEGQR